MSADNPDICRESVKGILGDLSQWDHYPMPSLIRDPVLKESCADIVTFIFRAQSHEGIKKVD